MVKTVLFWSLIFMLTSCGPGIKLKKIEQILTCSASSSSFVDNITNISALSTDDISLYAGAYGSFGNLDGVTEAARFYHPSDLAKDSSGNFFVVDRDNHRIRKVTSAGVVTTFAGGSAGAADGSGTSASFNSPRGIGIDSNDNLYVADTDNHTIRKITSAGVVTTFAGTAGVSGSTNASGTSATFNYPTDVVVDTNGNIFVADSQNNLIRKITNAGVVTTFAGSTSSGSIDGTGTDARFSTPKFLTIDSQNNLYVTDSINHTVRKITNAGVVTTIAGLAGINGHSDGAVNLASFDSPSGISIDSSSNLYVAEEGNHTIRKISKFQSVCTLAGSGSAGYKNLTGEYAQFDSPQGVILDSSKNILIADYNNHLLRKVAAGNVVSTLAGKKSDQSDLASYEKLSAPMALTADSGLNLYLAGSTSTIQEISYLTGNVYLLAGSGTAGSSDGTGENAEFGGTIYGMATDASGNVYVADYSNHSIRMITTMGVVTTIAGTSGLSGDTDATGASARFYGPYGIVRDSYGDFFVSDSFNHTIRKVTSAGVVTTFAGTSGISGSTDATGTSAKFNLPGAITIDSNDNLYVVDYGNHTIRKITNAGVVTTLAGTAGVSGYLDGTGAVVRFNYPQGISVDRFDDLYVSDTGNNVVRKVTSAGVATTVVGSYGSTGVTLGTLPGTLSAPKGMYVDTSDNMYLLTEDAVLNILLP